MFFFFLTVAAKIEWGKTRVTKNMDGGSFLQIRNKEPVLFQKRNLKFEFTLKTKSKGRSGGTVSGCQQDEVEVSRGRDILSIWLSRQIA